MAACFGSWRILLRCRQSTPVGSLRSASAQPHQRRPRAEPEAAANELEIAGRCRGLAERYRDLLRHAGRVEHHVVGTRLVLPGDDQPVPLPCRPGVEVAGGAQRPDQFAPERRELAETRQGLLVLALPVGVPVELGTEERLLEAG